MSRTEVVEIPVIGISCFKPVPLMGADLTGVNFTVRNRVPHAQITISKLYEGGAEEKIYSEVNLAIPAIVRHEVMRFINDVPAKLIVKEGDPKNDSGAYKHVTVNHSDGTSCHVSAEYAGGRLYSAGINLRDSRYVTVKRLGDVYEVRKNTKNLLTGEYEEYSVETHQIKPRRRI